MKRVSERTETVTNNEECSMEAAPKNEFHERAMALIESQLPVAIAIGREAAMYHLLRTLHLIAGGNSYDGGMNAPANACVGEGRKY